MIALVLIASSVYFFSLSRLYVLYAFRDIYTLTVLFIVNFSPPKKFGLVYLQVSFTQVTVFFFTEALKLYGERLSEWERNEIRKYPEVWFLGLEANKVQARSNLPNNCGFDDENGSYNKVSVTKIY